MVKKVAGQWEVGEGLWFTANKELDPANHNELGSASFPS